MGRCYKHISVEEREDIMCLRAEGKGVSEIARRVHRDKSTVSRELSRNGCPASSRPARPYRASAAQRRYELGRRLCRRRRRLADPALRSTVQSMIVGRRWSPEQVAGRLALERGRAVVSASTIRRAIRRRDLDTPGLRLAGVRVSSFLRRGGRRRRRRGDRRGDIPVPHELAERPAEASARSRPGDWEADTVVGRGAGPCLVTMVDRRSGLLGGGRARARTKAAVAEVEVRALSGQPARTVTSDRGKEFAGWAAVTGATGAEFYLCAAHHPWEKGCVENANGLLRQYFPKGTDFSSVTDEEVRAVYDELNRRPRKRLGWLTPWEVHYSEALRLL